MGRLLIKKKIQQFIEENFLFEFGNDITEDSNLFELGIIDSFGYVQLVSYLEKEFSINFTETDFLSNTLTSLLNIVDYVEQKQSKSFKQEIS